MTIDRNQYKQEIDRICLPYKEKRPNLVLNIGVIKEEEREIFSEGNRNGFEGNAPESLIYEIGSITKVFTASLLTKAIAENKLDPNHPIDQHLPSLADYESLKKHLREPEPYDLP
ncbi:hypothetical protein GCM10008986_14070 [Salinibacillus aidingensis]|uniref:Beta-lactamase-related domain-containing protein n=1 Tax=Salinibacillus aidingensis TaxID=237684 RepID=A0ABN1B3F1_9BACI